MKMLPAGYQSSWVGCQTASTETMSIHKLMAWQDANCIRKWDAYSYMCQMVLFCWSISAVAKAEKGFKIRRYPYWRYNKLKLVSFWPEGCLVFEKWCCSCRFCVQHAKLTHCLPKKLPKMVNFTFFLISWNMLPKLQPNFIILIYFT